MRRPGARALSLLALVALAACSGDATTVATDDDPTTTTTGASVPSDSGTGPALVLQVHTGGGFVPVEYAFSSIPEFSLYTDGRVIVSGPTTAEFPGAALPNLLTGTVDPDAVADALAAALTAGVADEPDLGEPQVADASTTTFVLVTGGRTTTLGAYALGMGTDPVSGETHGMSAAQVENRRRLEALRERLTTLGERAATDPYRATAVSVLVRPVTPPGPGAPAPEPVPGEVDWPLADLATGGVVQFGGRCLGVGGADLEQVLAATRRARSNTRWLSGGAAWSLILRPELPGAAPCAERR